MYITEEVVKHIQVTISKNQLIKLHYALQSAIIQSVLKIPEDKFIDLTPIWLTEHKREGYLMDSV
jgi:hypothetical protein